MRGGVGEIVGLLLPSEGQRFIRAYFLPLWHGSGDPAPGGGGRGPHPRLSTGPAPAASRS